MRFIRNRYVLAFVCFAASLAILFYVIPIQESSKTDTVKVIRALRKIPANSLVTGRMITEVEVGRYNLPESVIREKSGMLGKYAAVDIYPEDNITAVKLKDRMTLEDEFLYDTGDRAAVSVTVKTLATGLSGRLLPGDIVTVLVYVQNDKYGSDEAKGYVEEYPELQYVEVGSVANNKTQEVKDIKENSRDRNVFSSPAENVVPAVITFIVDMQQAKRLVEAENRGNIHIVFRGRGESAQRLLLLNGKTEKPGSAGKEPAAVQSGNPGNIGEKVSTGRNSVNKSTATYTGSASADTYKSDTPYKGESKANSGDTVEGKNKTDQRIFDFDLQ